MDNTTKEHLWKEYNKYLLKILKTLSQKQLIYRNCIFAHL